MTVLSAEELRRRFGNRHVVDGISLAIEARDSLALLGPSGCGKTTLLQMLGLLDRPDEGHVRLHDIDAWSLSTSRRAQLRLLSIGFVFQERNLLAQLSTADNVALPAWQLRGSRREALRRAHALLERFGLKDRAGARANELSTGEAQRAAIARALINNPLLVLADEPTGSLDSVSSEAVLDTLAEVREHGAALVIVTHDARVAARASRRIAMRDGRLHE